MCSSNSKSVISVSLDRELGEGREVVMVGCVGEMAVVRDEGTVGVAVPVATTERGQLAESVVESRESGCHNSMPTMHDTPYFPSLFTTFGKTSLTRRERFVTLILRPGNLSVFIECTTDNCTDSSEFSWNLVQSLYCYSNTVVHCLFNTYHSLESISIHAIIYHLVAA